jgi:hypothetical protein
VADVAEVATTTAAAALDRGDLAWFSGHRGPGLRAWREALRLADAETSDGVAIAAMARLRLLHGGSTWSLFVHGPKIDRAVDRCPPSNPWCRRLFVDYELLAPPGIGDTVIGLEAARALASVDPVGSASRIGLATGDLSAIEAIPEADRDGLGRALLLGRGPEPGPWTILPTFSAGPPFGLGGGLHFAHPDVLRRQIAVSVDGLLGTQGHLLSLSALFPGKPRWLLTASTFEIPFDDDRYGSHQASFGPIFQLSRAWSLRLAATARWDGIGALLAGHEVLASLDRRPVSNRKGWGTTLSVTSTVPKVTDYDRYDALLEGRLYVPVGPVVWASRLRGEGALGDPPDIRKPSVGGGDLLRGAAYGADRGRWLAGADTEVRVPIGSISPVIFGDGAVVEGRWHGGFGAGVRIAAGDTALALDLGWTDLGAGFAIRYGEVF